MASSWVIVALVFAPLVLANDPSLVTVADGTLRGAVYNASRAFLGVPYAAPPLGSLRWKPPSAPASWSGIRDATAYSADCIYLPTSWYPLTNQSEDCLYLNVFTPIDASPENKYPVMIWVHGGCYAEGGIVAGPSGRPDVELAEDVIIVTLGYRNNIFGFLGGDDVRAWSGDGSSGNFGLQDQRAAFQWVNTNIASFGGDETNIMIYGESAGAGSVAFHLVAPRSDGLYVKAGMESGAFAVWNAQPYVASQKSYAIVLSYLNCTDLACVISKTADELVQAGIQVMPGGKDLCLYRGCPWSPIIDGVELTMEPWQLLQAGKFSHVPLLLGTNRDEGAAFIKVADIAKDAYPFVLAYVWSNLPSAEVVGNVTALYPPSSYPSTPVNGYYWSLMRAVTDFSFFCMTRRTALIFADAGLPVYQYIYEHTSPGSAFVPHGVEVNYVFYSAFNDPGAKNMSAAMVDYWTNFAVSGNPNGNALFNWPAYTSETRQSLVINLEMSLEANHHAEQCAYWDSLIQVTSTGCVSTTP